MYKSTKIHTYVPYTVLANLVICLQLLLHYIVPNHQNNITNNYISGNSHIHLHGYVNCVEFTDKVYLFEDPLVKAFIFEICR